MEQSKILMSARALRGPLATARIGSTATKRLAVLQFITLLLGTTTDTFQQVSALKPRMHIEASDGRAENAEQLQADRALKVDDESTTAENKEQQVLGQKQNENTEVAEAESSKPDVEQNSQHAGVATSVFPFSSSTLQNGQSKTKKFMERRNGDEPAWMFQYVLDFAGAVTGAVKEPSGDEDGEQGCTAKEEEAKMLKKKASSHFFLDPEFSTATASTSAFVEMDVLQKKQEKSATLVGTVPLVQEYTPPTPHQGGPAYSTYAADDPNHQMLTEADQMTTTVTNENVLVSGGAQQGLGCGKIIAIVAGSILGLIGLGLLFWFIYTSSSADEEKKPVPYHPPVVVQQPPPPPVEQPKKKAKKKLKAKKKTPGGDTTGTETEADPHGAPNAKGDALSFDEKHFISEHPARKSIEVNLDPTVVENALIDAGVSGGYAKMCANQICDKYVHDGEFLLRPSGDGDEKVLMQFGLSWDDGPEYVGRMREFLMNLAERQKQQKETEQALQQHGFSPQAAEFLAERLVDDLDDDDERATMALTDEDKTLTLEERRKKYKQERKKHRKGMKGGAHGHGMEAFIEDADFQQLASPKDLEMVKEITEETRKIPPVGILPPVQPGEEEPKDGKKSKKIKPGQQRGAVDIDAATALPSGIFATEEGKKRGKKWKDFVAPASTMLMAQETANMNHKMHKKHIPEVTKENLNLNLHVKKVGVKFGKKEHFTVDAGMGLMRAKADFAAHQEEHEAEEVGDAATTPAPAPEQGDEAIALGDRILSKKGSNQSLGSGIDASRVTVQPTGVKQSSNDQSLQKKGTLDASSMPGLPSGLFPDGKPAAGEVGAHSSAADPSVPAVPSGIVPDADGHIEHYKDIHLHPTSLEKRHVGGNTTPPEQKGEKVEIKEKKSRKEKSSRRDHSGASTASVGGGINNMSTVPPVPSGLFPRQTGRQKSDASGRSDPSQTIGGASSLPSRGDGTTRNASEQQMRDNSTTPYLRLDDTTAGNSTQAGLPASSAGARIPNPKTKKSEKSSKDEDASDSNPLAVSPVAVQRGMAVPTPSVAVPNASARGTTQAAGVSGREKYPSIQEPGDWVQSSGDGRNFLSGKTTQSKKDIAAGGGDGGMNSTLQSVLKAPKEEMEQLSPDAAGNQSMRKSKNISVLSGASMKSGASGKSMTSKRADPDDDSASSSDRSSERKQTTVKKDHRSLLFDNLM
ncbi:unnamed protein product [Amoebophrya sp. A120]|nr:unnamed protein product [Amoebophrya sp. A120]|eukprot:GSA120T00025203001.1